MTKTFDKLMIRAGFEAGQVQRVKHRRALYMGNLAMLAVSALFLAMLVL